MADYNYASKGVANTALGLAIAGTTLGVMNPNNNGGLLGGLFGNNGQQDTISVLRSENALLQAEKYTDRAVIDAYKKSVENDKELRDEMFAFIKPIAEGAVNNRVKLAGIESEMKCNVEKADLREQIIAGKINEVALTTSGRFSALDQTIANIGNKLDCIGCYSVKNSAVCPGWGPVCVQPLGCPEAAAAKREK